MGPVCQFRTDRFSRQVVLLVESDKQPSHITDAWREREREATLELLQVAGLVERVCLVIELLRTTSRTVDMTTFQCRSDHPAVSDRASLFVG
jgi:hypothetical protein